MRFTFLTKMFFSACAMLVLTSACAKKPNASSDQLGVAPPLSPASSASPSDASAVRTISELATTNLAKCEDFFTNAADLQALITASIEAGRIKELNGQPAGLTPPPPSNGEINNNACRLYLQDSMEKLGALLARQAIENQTLQKWVSDVRDWLFKPPANVKRALTVAFMSAHNAHVTGSCPATRFVGGITDCGGGVCNGTQAACAQDSDIKFGPNGNDTQVITELAVTPHGAHSTAPPCPTGMVVVGGGADCGGGVCNGVQLLCAKMVSAKQMTQGQQYMTDYTVTPYGAHSFSPQCPTSHPQNLGGFADCAGAVCNGVQLFCGANAAVAF